MFIGAKQRILSNKFISTGTKIIDSINLVVHSFLGENDLHINIKHLIANVWENTVLINYYKKQVPLQ